MKSSEEHDNFDLSPDGFRILAAGANASGTNLISIIDLVRGVVSRAVPPDQWANDPVWAPDGQQFAYTQRIERSKIVVRPVAGGEDRVVFDPPDADSWVEDWSRDGRFLVVGSAKGWQEPHVFLVPLDGGRAVEIAVEGGIVDEYHFSPDGRWLAYNSDASGRHEIYVTALPSTGARWQVSSAGGVQARWSGDGRELYYLSPDGFLMAVDVKSGDSFNASAPRRLFAVPDGLGSPILDEYAVTRDGKRFLISEPLPSSELPINVIVNWPPR